MTIDDFYKCIDVHIDETNIYTTNTKTAICTFIISNKIEYDPMYISDDIIKNHIVNKLYNELKSLFDGEQNEL